MSSSEHLYNQPILSPKEMSAKGVECKLAPFGKLCLCQAVAISCKENKPRWSDGLPHPEVRKRPTLSLAPSPDFKTFQFNARIRPELEPSMGDEESR